MIVNIIDTEYLSLSKSHSIEKLRLNKDKLFPEIIQIGRIKYDLKLNKIIKKNNYFFFPVQKIPKRITSLTNLNENILKIKKTSKNKILNILNDIKQNEIICSNGDDLQIIKLNFTYYKLKKKRRKYNFLNLRKVFNNKNTSTIQKNLKTSTKRLKHDALEDCKTLLIALKIEKKKNNKLKYFIEKNLQKILI